MTRPIVFLGPCLPRTEAAALLDADYRPPARRGDVLAAARQSPPLIGILDGVFLHALAPSPREVLHALETGVPILGGSSLGALRAAELHTFGMIGVGRIFELYRDRRLFADDEVALVFAADDLRPLSEPMVNLRYGLSAAHAAGILSTSEKNQLVRIGKSIYFPERSWPRLLREAAGHLPVATLAHLHEFVCAGDHDLKAHDARLLLAEAARRLGHGTGHASTGAPGRAGSLDVLDRATGEQPGQ